MKPFTFYDIYYTPLQALSDEQAGKFFRKICNCLEGKQTETDGKDTPEFELYWESIADDIETYRNSTGKSCGLDKRYRHFPFLTFYQKAFTYLSDGEGGAFVKMLCAYIFESKEPEKTETDGKCFLLFRIYRLCKRRKQFYLTKLIRLVIIIYTLVYGDLSKCRA